MNSPPQHQTNQFEGQITYSPSSYDAGGSQMQEANFQHIPTSGRVQIDSMLDALNSADWLDNVFDFAAVPDTVGKGPVDNLQLDMMHAAPADNHFRSMGDYAHRVFQNVGGQMPACGAPTQSDTTQITSIPGFLSASLREELTELYDQVTRLREECAHRDRQIQRMRAYIVKNEAWSQSISETVSHHQAWIHGAQTSGTASTSR